MRSNLDVWAVQKEPNDFQTALANIKKDSEKNILFSNCHTNFCIGNHKIKSKKFNVVLSSEESDVLILFMKDGVATVEDVRKYLDDKEINYHEVIFKEPKNQIPQDSSLKELWFAREKAVLEDAILDSKSKQHTTCTYYPKVRGKLEIGYTTEKNYFVEVEERMLKGLVEFDDKIVILINQYEKRNMNEIQVYETLNENEIDINIECSRNKYIEPINKKEKVKAKRP